MPSNTLDKTFSAVRKHLLECREPITAVDDDPCHNPVYEALICDTQEAALLTAVTTSSVNALASAPVAIDPADIKRFTPHDPSAVVATGACLPEAGIGPDVVCAIKEFFTALTEARRSLERYFVDAAELGADRAQLLHHRTLTGVWRASCRDAMAAIRQLDTTLPDWLPQLYADNGGVLLKLLKTCEAGGNPCLDSAGRPYLPDLPQRRRNMRRALCEPCVLTWRRKSHQAFVRDLSAGGFGLERVPDLEPGELVVVQMGNGRRFTTVVAWRRGQTAGVRFGTPLAPGDPLLVG